MQRDDILTCYSFERPGENFFSVEAPPADKATVKQPIGGMRQIMFSLEDFERCDVSPEALTIIMNRTCHGGDDTEAQCSVLRNL